MFIISVYLLINEYLLKIVGFCFDLISYIRTNVLINRDRKTQTSAGMVKVRCLLNYHAVQLLY